MRVLVGYASRFGSTRDIAIRIAGTVRTQGNDVDVLSIDEISDLDHYDAFVGTDITASLLYPDYNFIDQTVSELFAIGAPTSRIVVPLFTVSSTLSAAFAFGVWASCGHSRALGWLATMIFANAANAVLLWNVFPLPMRGVTPTFTDAMHLVLAANPFVLLSIVFGTVAFNGWFRAYSVVTVLILLVPGVFSFSYATAVAANQPAPGMGLAERLAQYGYQLWR
jgi:hypothetical protein